MTPIEIRPARADDVEAAVPLIYSSGPAQFNYVFCRERDGEAQDFLRHSFVRGAGQFGFRNHTVAVSAGRIVGIGACYSGDSHLAFVATAVRQFLGFYGRAGAGVIWRGLQAERVMPPPSRSELMISHLGVAPDLRGSGIGKQVIEHFLERGRAFGKSMAVLDVSVENPRAQGLYQRLEFTVKAERRSLFRSAHGYIPNHRRMHRPLNP